MEGAQARISLCLLNTSSLRTWSRFPRRRSNCTRFKLWTVIRPKSLDVPVADEAVLNRFPGKARESLDLRQCV